MRKKISYVVLIFLLIIKLFLFFLNIYIPILDFILFGVFLILFHFIFFNRNTYRNYQSSLAKTVFIIVFSYFIIYYFLGLFVGFNFNSYDTSFFGILSNVILLICPLLFREEIRLRFIWLHKNKKSSVFITIIFIFTELLRSSILNFQTNQELFSNVFSIFFPVIIENILLTYLAYVGGRRSALVYFIPVLVSRYIVPIIPNLDCFFQLLLQIVLTYMIYFFVTSEYLLRVERKYRRKVKSQTYLYVLCCFGIVVLGLFVAGVFKYQPVAILTYSMEPTFTRGDAVIVQKLDSDGISNLKKGDIVQYRKGNVIVIHRIINVFVENNERVFVFKGDNNKSRDSDLVYSDQIMGKILFSIPKIGYPSVWLNEFLFSDDNVSVEVGR